MKIEEVEEDKEEEKQVSKPSRPSRVLSMSPKNIDRAKLMNMMKNYTFKWPNMRRIISPHKRVFSNGRIETIQKDQDTTCHYIDLNAIKQNLMKKVKFERPLKAKAKAQQNSRVEDLFNDSSFVKPASQKKETIDRKKHLKKLISDNEIDQIRDQIWMNINQKKVTMDL